MSKTYMPYPPVKSYISTLHHPAARSYMEFWHSEGGQVSPDRVTVRYIVNDATMGKGIHAVPQLNGNDVVVGCDVRYGNDPIDKEYFYLHDTSSLMGRKKARCLWHCLVFAGWGRAVTAEWKQYP